jgi:hypothetical protein
MIGFGGVLTDEESGRSFSTSGVLLAWGMEEGWEGAGWVLVRTRAAADDERRNGEPIFEF